MSQYYTAVVSPVGPECFDVRLYRGKRRAGPTDHVITVCSTKKATIYDISQYFAWKFRTVGCESWNATNGVYCKIPRSFEWIESIILVEFDYHLGAKECMRPENAAAMEAYKADPCAGYRV